MRYGCHLRRYDGCPSRAALTALAITDGFQSSPSQDLTSVLFGPAGRRIDNKGERIGIQPLLRVRYRNAGNGILAVDGHSGARLA